MSHASRGLNEDIKEEFLVIVHPLGRLLASMKIHDVSHTHMRKCETLCIYLDVRPTTPRLYEMWFKQARGHHMPIMERNMKVKVKTILDVM